MNDRELAAIILIAVESGLLSANGAVSVVDREIEAREVADGWLIEASLARSIQDLVHVLRGRAADHPMIVDELTLLEAIDVASVHATADLDRLVSAVLDRYPYSGLPVDVQDLIYQLDEEATCAHGHDGEPQPRAIEEALQALLAAARGRSGRREMLERMLMNALAARIAAAER
jgi:hypothetical protein